MKILLIGATGFIGKALAKRLLADGHEVAGLARTAEAATTLAAVGVVPLLAPKGFDDVDLLVAEAAKCDAIIDVAAHDFVNNASVMLKLRAALSAGKVLISTTGAFFYGDVPDSKITPISEDRPYGFAPQVAEAWALFESSVLEGARQDLRTCILRPGLVYGHGGCDRTVLGTMRAALKRGASVYVDDGRDGAMCTVHVDDLADLYEIVLNSLASGVLPTGSIVNATSGYISHKVKAERVAVACGGLPVEPLNLQDAAQKMGPFDIFKETLVLVLDCSKARGLGWNPSRISLADDLSSGSYKGLQLDISML